MSKQFSYQLVATGGTFDRFHKGHAALLNKAFEVGKKVIIGVTSDEMVARENKILKETILPYKQRVSEMLSFLKSQGFFGREIIEKLDDPFGPTVFNNQIQAVICTRETRKKAVAINKERKKINNSPLKIIECPFISSPDRYHISSTRIRLGQIDREGSILSRFSIGTRLPPLLRGYLSHPIDKLYICVREVFNEAKKPVMLVAIGDFVNQELHKLGKKPDLSIIDLKINRKKIDLPAFRFVFDFVVRNQAGTVSPSLIQTLKKAVKIFLLTKKSLSIRIIGEEDLAVLPAILILPLQSVIIYGQPAKNRLSAGVVKVDVTEEKKKWVLTILRRFK